MKVLTYAHHRTNRWWEFLGNRLTFAGKSKVLSEFRGAGDIDVGEKFRRVYKSWTVSDTEALLPPELCFDIASRCRLLRQLDTPKALRAVGAMWSVLEEVVDRESPSVALSFLIDYYALDIFEKILARRGVALVGLCAAIFDRQMMFTIRGEHNRLREASEAEIEPAMRQILSPQFGPFLPAIARYGDAAFLKRWAYYRARGAYFAGLRTLRNDHLNFHYAATHGIGSESKIRLSHRGLSRAMRSDWEEVLQRSPIERRLFIALQVNPEATIDYWVADHGLARYNSVLEKLVEAFGSAGYTIVIKDHPNMFGFRGHRHLERVLSCPNVLLVPYETPSQKLIEYCGATFTWTGSVGIQSALAGRCSIVVNPYYFHSGAFLQLSSVEEISQLPARVDAFRPGAVRDFMKHLLGAVVPGDASTWQGFSPDREECVRNVESLVESLNTYVPLMMQRAAEKARSSERAPRPVRQLS